MVIRYNSQANIHVFIMIRRNISINHDICHNHNKYNNLRWNDVLRFIILPGETICDVKLIARHNRGLEHVERRRENQTKWWHEVKNAKFQRNTRFSGYSSLTMMEYCDLLKNLSERDAVNIERIQQQQTLS